MLKTETACQTLYNEWLRGLFQHLLSKILVLDLTERTHVVSDSLAPKIVEARVKNKALGRLVS